MGDAITGRSASNALEVLSWTPVDWFDKNQNQVEMVTCSSKFVVAQIGCEHLINLHHVLQSFGVPLGGSSWMLRGNVPIATSSATPHPRLSDHWNALLCHHAQEAVAGSWLCFEHILGVENPVGVLTEPHL